MKIIFYNFRLSEGKHSSYEDSLILYMYNLCELILRWCRDSEQFVVINKLSIK